MIDSTPINGRGGDSGEINQCKKLTFRLYQANTIPNGVEGYRAE